MFLPLPPLNNVEKQRANIASSYVMGSQHYIGGEGGFLNTLETVRKGLLQAHHDRCCSLVKLLRIYFYYSNLFNHG